MAEPNTTQLVRRSVLLFGNQNSTELGIFLFADSDTVLSKSMFNESHNIFFHIFADFAFKFQVVTQNSAPSTEYCFTLKVVDVVGACPSCLWVKVGLHPG